MKINRRKFVAGLGAAAAATAGAGFLINSVQNNLRKKLPNIILFLADDMRYDATGYLGNKIIKTPMLDALSRDSFIFENNFVTTSICPVSRASILSGQYARRHGVHGFTDPLKESSMHDSYMARLHEAGYYTGFIGKWGISGEHPVKWIDFWHGYDGQGVYFDAPRSGHITDIQTGVAMEFLQKKRPSDRPFMLCVSYKAPHDPLEPQPRFFDVYNNVTIPRAPLDTTEAYNRLPPLLKSSLNRHSYLVHCGNEGIYQSYVKRYYELITGLDDSIGTILRWLDEHELRDDTTILVTSDNGMMLGEHGLSGKWCMYEDSIRVPLLVQPSKRFFPALHPTTIRALTLNIDIAPTIISSASLPVPERMQGMDMLPLMLNRHAPWREGFFYEHPPQSTVVPCIGYRGKEWKYTRYNVRDRINDVLFNLRDDPTELDNLSRQSRYEPILKEMQRLTFELHENLM